MREMRPELREKLRELGVPEDFPTVEECEEFLNERPRIEDQEHEGGRGWEALLEHNDDPLGRDTPEDDGLRIMLAEMGRQIAEATRSTDG